MIRIRGKEKRAVHKVEILPLNSFLKGKMSGEEYLEIYRTMTNLLTCSDNNNREKFLTWYDVANRIMHNEFQKGFQDKMRDAFGFDITNSEMEFLTDKAESSKPLEIIQIRTGETLNYNLSPMLETVNPNDFSEQDMAVINTYLKTMLAKSSYTKQLGSAVTDAFAYGTGVMKIEHNLLPSNFYKVHENLSANYVHIGNLIVDDNIQEIQNMSYVGEIEYVNPDIFYANMTEDEREAWRYMVDNNYVMTNQTGFAASYIDSKQDNWFYIDYISQKGVVRNKSAFKNKKCSHITMYVKDVDHSLKTTLKKIDIFCGVIYSVTKVKQNLFPYESISFYPRVNNFYGTSLLYLMMDAYILHLRSIDAISTSLLFASSPVYEADISAIQNDPSEIGAYLNSPGGVISSVGGDAIRRIERSNLTVEMNNVYNQTKEQMYEVAGLTKFTTGQNSGSITTSGGIAMMQQAGGTATQIDVTTLEQFTKNIVYLTLQTISDYNGMIKAKVNKNSGIKVSQVELIADTVDKLDIIIQVSSQQVNTQNALIAFTQLLQLVPESPDGSTDELRDLLMSQIAENVPIDQISKEKLKLELLSTMEKVRKAKESNNKEQMTRGNTVSI